MRLLPVCFLTLAQVRSQIPKCEPPELPEGTRMVCPRGRKNGDKCTTSCEPGFIKTGRDITITCRCVRLKAGIKCKFNEHPAECIREGHGQLGRDGRVMVAPTRQPETTKAGRQVFYPGGTPPSPPKAKPAKRPNNVNIGGFEARQPSTIERNGVSFNSNNKANVGSSLQATLARQIELLQAQQDQINTLINKPPPAKVGIPTIPFGGGSITANFDNAQEQQQSVDRVNLLACGDPSKIGVYSIVDKWDTGLLSERFMASVNVDLSMINDDWNVAVSFPEKIYPGNVQVWNARFVKHSDDGKTLLFSSKSRHSKMAEGPTLPKFGFVISDLPVYSAKPQSGSVIYYDRKLQSSCVDGENICNGATMPSSSNQMFAAESYARTTARPTTTTPKPTTTTKKMSLMELLQQRKKMMEAPQEAEAEDDFFVIPTNNPVSYQSENIAVGPQSSGGNDICANQIMGEFIRLNSWYTEETGMSGVSAKIELTVGQPPSQDFEINVQFTVPVHNIEVWTFQAIPSDNPSLWQFKKKLGYSYNSNMDFDINTLSPTPNHEDISAIVVYCDGAATNLAALSVMGQAGLSGSTGSLRPNDKSQLFQIQNSGGNFNHRDQLSKDRDVKQLIGKMQGELENDIMSYPYSPRCTGSIPRGLPPMAPRQSNIQCAESDPDLFKYDLKRVLCLSGYFYKAQRVGPTASRDVPWRGIAGLKHGCDIQKDLVGGWYDAGDNVIFTFPLAYTITMLSWSVIEFKDAFVAAGEYEKILRELKWGTDFLIKAHISKFELVGLVGDPHLDHKKWMRPEDPTSPKTPTFIIDADNPGSELAAEASAALAAAHLVFRWAEQEDYADLCLQHALELFEFADTYRGSYHDSIPKVYDFYRSWEGYEDELAWAAIWLFGATSDNVMLTASMAFYKKSGQLNRKPIDWDNKWPGVRLLLARLTKDEELARESLSRLRKTISSAKYTPKGLIFINEWGPLRHAANHAFLAFVSTKLDLDNSDDLLDFAKKQMFYIYGEGGRSYIVGFGKNYPTKPHHRSSSCPVSPQECGWDVADDKMSPNPWILFGALVGGPDRFDSFINDRKNHQQSEVTLDYNAALVGGTAGLLYYIDLNYLTGV